MVGSSSIVIGDQSAAALYAHSACRFMQARPLQRNPLRTCADTSAGLHAFNYDHPLFGGRPVTLMVPEQAYRRRTEIITCHSAHAAIPPKSFYELREGLYIACPELVFARMGLYLDLIQLAELGMSLCARYYIGANDAIEDRPFSITTPKKLSAYLDHVPEMRGSMKARRALALVMANSGSPVETKMALQFCVPLRMGGFKFPFTAMNYEISAGKMSSMTLQSAYSIDLASPQRKFGLEYDGEAYHEDSSKDKRRRNELKALGWEIFPIDKNVLFDARATKRAGEQIATCLHMRLRRPPSWEESFTALRKSLHLPVENLAHGS